MKFRNYGLHNCLVFHRYIHHKRFLKFVRVLIQVQTKFRCKLARRVLGQLRMDAKSVKKIAEERDQLLEI